MKNRGQTRIRYLVRAAVTLLNNNTAVSVNAQSSPNGQYIFDFINPGTYIVTVEMAGFNKFVAKDILVQARADVTIEARLQTGSTTESITVEASAAAVQFNNSTMSLTIDIKMTSNCHYPSQPVPVGIAQPLRRSALDDRAEPIPPLAASHLDVGGSTTEKNEITCWPRCSLES